jgi:glutathione S-transferase
LIRILTIPKYEEYGLVPKSILTSLETKAPAFWKWANTVIKQTSVNHIFDEEAVAKRTAAKIAKLAAK